MPEIGQELSRRDLLKKGGLVVAGALAIEAISSEHNPTRLERLVSEYYPGLEGRPTTTLAAPNTLVLNYLQQPVDRSALRELYKFYENIKGSTFIYGNNGHDVPFTLTGIPALQRIMFVVPGNTPDPNGYPYNTDNGALTNSYGNTRKPVMVSYVGKTGNTAWLNKEFTTEVAQSEFRITAPQEQLSHAFFGNTQEQQAALQETIANSLGRAVTLRTNGTPYDAYREIVSHEHLYSPLTGPLYELYVLPKSIYEQIPSAPPFKT